MIISPDHLILTEFIIEADLALISSSRLARDEFLKGTALTEVEQKRFLRAVERCPSIRDQAVAILLFYTGLRVSECAALDQSDVLISARKGTVIVRQGKREAYREVPLNAGVRKALDNWLVKRQEPIYYPQVGFAL